MPGDLHKLWRTRDPKGYHVEYGYSCMGYEIAGGLGVKLAAPDREVYVMVGDGSFLMMAQEIVTAVQEDDQAHDRARPEPRLRSRSARSRSRVGSQRFGTAYRDATEELPSTSRGGRGPRRRASTARRTIDELEAGAARGDRLARVTVVEIQTDPLVGAPDSEAWWDVPVAEVAGLDSTRAARETYEQNKRTPAAVPEHERRRRRHRRGDDGGGARPLRSPRRSRARTSPPSPTSTARGPRQRPPTARARG